MTIEWVGAKGHPWDHWFLSTDSGPLMVRAYHDSRGIVVADSVRNVTLAGPFDTLDAAKAAYLMILEGGQ